MSIIETIGCGLMTLGLVLGAMTGTIAMLLIPVAAGMLVFAAVSWHHKQLIKRANAWRAKYPPYKY